MNERFALLERRIRDLDTEVKENQDFSAQKFNEFGQKINMHHDQLGRLNEYKKDTNINLENLKQGVEKTTNKIRQVQEKFDGHLQGMREEMEVRFEDAEKNIHDQIDHVSSWIE